MRLLIIRHGQSEADILRVHEGRADFELTELGRRQAEAMSVYVAGKYSVDKIFHSTLKRAARTASYLAESTRAPLFPEEKLMEFGNGLVAGLSYSEAAEKYPAVSVPMHLSVYGQETVLEFRYRAEYMLSKLINENPPGSTVAVVTHGGMINQLYRAFLRLSPDSDYAFYTGDAAFHEWLTDGEKRVVVKANYISYSL